MGTDGKQINKCIIAKVIITVEEIGCQQEHKVGMYRGCAKPLCADRTQAESLENEKEPALERAAGSVGERTWKAVGG